MWWRSVCVGGISAMGLLGSACVVDLAVPAGSRVSCVGVSECPEGMTCRAGFCVDPGTVDTEPPDFESPVTVEPPVGNEEGVFVITLYVTEPLASSPEVTLGLDLPSQVSCNAAAAQTFTCSYSATGDENGGLGGSVALDVYLRDNAGNETVRRQAAFFTLDFVDPSLAAQSLVPSPTPLDATLEVFFTASEALAGPVVLQITPGLTNDFGVLETECELSPDPGTLNHRYRHRVTANDAEGEVRFATVLRDRAGNEAPATVGTAVLDPTPPGISELTSDRTRYSATPPFNQVAVTFNTTEALGGDGSDLVVLFDGVDMDCDPYSELIPNYHCTYEVNGDETPAGTEVVKTIFVQARDSAGNQTSAGIGVLVDLASPQVSAGSVAYLPAVGNPLPIVARAAVETVVTVTLVADELLDTSYADTKLLAIHQATSTALPFALAAGGMTPTRVTFVTSVPMGQPDGTYDLRVSWRDQAGNVADPASSSDPLTVSVLTTKPTLTVGQDHVTFVRSPWGNGAPELLTTPDDAFAILAGPGFALAPTEPLVGASTLPADAFVFSDRAVYRLRLWSAAAQGELLGSAAPGNSGLWPRVSLAPRDMATLWATGIDDAGNESDAIAIAQAEWVATPRPPATGENPHILHTLARAADTLSAPDPGVIDNDTVSAPDAQVVTVATGLTWHEHRPSAVVPELTTTNSMAMDSARGVLVLMTYTTVFKMWELDGESWTTVSTSGIRGPRERFSFSLVYDPMRGRVMMFGGASYSAVFDDFWEWNGLRWTERPKAGDWPEARKYHAMAIDQGRGCLVLFGGHNGMASLADLWEWNGDEWHQHPQVGEWPDARVLHSMTYDAQSGHTLLFGGNRDVASAQSDLMDDLWAWDGSTWQDLTLASLRPEPRQNATLTFNAATGSTFLFGGFAGPGSWPDDLWEYTPAGWAKPTVVGSGPAGREAASFVYDPHRGRSLLYGGGNGSGAPTNSIWGWTNTGAWEEIQASALLPAARNAAPMVFDEVRRGLLVYGGSSASHAPLDDTWEWAGGRWSLLSAGAPAGRSAPAIAYDSGSKRAVMFGGYYNSFPYQFDETWHWNAALPQWQLQSPATTRPTMTTSAVMAYTGDGMILFGGRNESGFTLGTWLWDGADWHDAAPTHSPPPRTASAMTYHEVDDIVLLFGGYNGSTPTDDLWLWDGADWSEQPKTYPWPRQRFGHGMVYDPDRATTVVVGGQFDAAASSVGNDIWEWTSTGWQQRTVLGTTPAPRAGHAMAFSQARGETMLFGGGSVLKNNDLWSLNAELDRQPAVQWTVSLATAGFAAAEIRGMRVRAWCQGESAAGLGAALYAWLTHGPDVVADGWVALEAAGFVPCPASNSALAPPLDWCADGTVARRLVRHADRTVTLQCRPRGATLDGVAEAQVDVDYLELRVRYQSL